MRFRGCAVWATKEIPSGDTERIVQRLRIELERAVCHGFTDFFIGGLSVFNRLAAERLLELRGQNYPVMLEMILPYWEALPRLSAEEHEKWLKVLSEADEVDIAYSVTEPRIPERLTQLLLYKSERCITYGVPAVVGNYARYIGSEWIDI